MNEHKLTSSQRRAQNRSRRSMHHTRPASPTWGKRENARRVRQMAKGWTLAA